MMDIISQSFAPLTLWAAFTAGILVLLILDLILLHGTSKEISMRAALLETAAWISVSLLFNGWLYFYQGAEIGLEFFAGYLIEKSLSMDNVFVILLIFSSLSIPEKYQHRVLFWGILGAIVFRAVLILVGSAMMTHFHWILYLFGGILIYSAWNFLRSRDHQIDPDNHPVMRILARLVPVTKSIQGQDFFVMENGIRKATPLLAALVIVEASDLIFAIDSIPAVFAVTNDPFIAFSSNILAILGLRALYFVVARSLKQIRYLKPGLAVLLGFVGVKMLLIDFVKIPIWVSLSIIGAILLTATLGSLYVNLLEKNKDREQ